MLDVSVAMMQRGRWCDVGSRLQRANSQSMFSTCHSARDIPKTTACVTPLLLLRPCSSPLLTPSPLPLPPAAVGPSGAALVGRRVEVWWPMDAAFYSGLVERYIVQPPEPNQGSPGQGVSAQGMSAGRNQGTGLGKGRKLPGRYVICSHQSLCKGRLDRG